MTDDEFFLWFEEKYYKNKNLIGKHFKCLKTDVGRITGNVYLIKGKFYEIIHVEQHNKPSCEPRYPEYLDFYGYLFRIKGETGTYVTSDVKDFEYNIEELRDEKITNLLK